MTELNSEPKSQIDCKKLDLKGDILGDVKTDADGKITGAKAVKVMFLNDITDDNDAKVHEDWELAFIYLLNNITEKVEKVRARRLLVLAK